VESGVIRLEEWLPAILDNPIRPVVDQWRSLSVLEECREHLTDLDPNGDYRFAVIMLRPCQHQTRGADRASVTARVSGLLPLISGA
jgi:hypothetical protein